jgi:cytochrome c peroxidase
MRLMASVGALERESKLRLTKEFGREALAGMKIFYRTEGAASVGNCVACHVPPAFTDFSFHNTGESQAEYDVVHGEGAFAALKIPKVAEARRPIKRLADKPLARDPAIADLGHWNFVDLKSSPLRGPNESEDGFLDRMVATFKTPTLRSLGFTQAYIHNGQFDTLDAALAEIVHLNSLARSGRLRSVDPEYMTMNLSAADIAPLVAFLVALNEKYD